MCTLALPALAVEFPACAGQPLQTVHVERLSDDGVLQLRGGAVLTLGGIRLPDRRDKVFQAHVRAELARRLSGKSIEVWGPQGVVDRHGRLQGQIVLGGYGCRAIC